MILDIQVLRERAKDLGARVATLRDQIMKQAQGNDVRSMPETLSAINGTVGLSMAISQVSYRLDLAEMIQIAGADISDLIPGIASELTQIERDVRDAQA